MRNMVAILAIALTSILFTTLFTIGLSLNEGFEQANFRQAGGYSHGTFKYLSKDQFDSLKEDPLIKEYGLRRFVGMPVDNVFQKSHVEVGSSDANQRKWMYLKPIEGNFPKEGTREAATDTRVLSLLGIEPVLGTQFTMTIDVDGTETRETFTLSGWWDYDDAIVASHVIIPESRSEEIFKKLGTTGKDGMTGTWNMDFMLRSSMQIADTMDTILASHGYQSQHPEKPNFISTGVNWGYTGAQLSSKMDAGTLVGAMSLLLLIVFTGYLIIYNVFQISVAGDIRFYGLLKTIGTTPKQLKRIVRQQALVLSAVGVPFGLVIGYFLGVLLTPVILTRLNGVMVDAKSASPVIFLASALFSLITVFLSCARPGKIAANVSPIEAVRYAEGEQGKFKGHKSSRGVSIPKMAFANLGRKRGKTAITLISLSLAIILLNLTVTFTNGFDLDKYLRNVVVDFTVAETEYFQVARGWSNEGVEENIIESLQEQGAITGGGRVYGKVTPAQEFVEADYFRSRQSAYNPPEVVDWLLANSEKLPNGKVADHVQLYGMEDFVLGKATTLEGDIEKLKDPSGRYIAAVYLDDDYGNPKMNSHWAKLGDTVTVRYIDEQEFYNPETGEVYKGEVPEGVSVEQRVLSYRDVEYEVAALVTIPHSLSYRYYGSDEFIMSAQTLQRDTKTNVAMYYAFDTTEESKASMEQFLSELTQGAQSQYDYESKESYKAEFESFRTMFLILGSVLSFIIGLIGLLNFLNAMLTSMISRRKEFAILQSIGMTGKQLKGMLVWESLYYTIGAVLLCFLLYVATAPALGSALNHIFWFFSYQFTILPILLCIPFMLLISFVVPFLGYKHLIKQSVVERLREAE